MIPKFFDLQNSQLKISFLDVGQGDAALIQTVHGGNILIDGGPDGSVINQLGNLINGNERIDLMILTHPHADHYMGLVEVVQRFRVERLVFSGAISNSVSFRDFLDLVSQRDMPVSFVVGGETIYFDKTQIKILNPSKSEIGYQTKEPNNSSVVTQIVFGQNSIMMTGDLEKNGEKRVLRKSGNIHSQILKVGHHGSKTSSTDDFVKAISPKWAIISVAKYNKYYHPSKDVVNRLIDLGATVFRTDSQGTISFMCDLDHCETIL